MTGPGVAWTTEVTRRRALTLIGAAGLAVVAAACADDGGGDTGTRTESGSSGGTGGSTTGGGSNASQVDCVLTPEMTEGPYYLEDMAVRRDIAEGRPGVPLQLELTVADASTCTPVPDLMVEIWHADAEGDYSGFGAGGSTTTFLRGGQPSDAQGVATFDTIYPGWYQGRAVHIHLKVHDGRAVHTTQLFFDQDLTDDVFTQAPYAGNSGGTTNAQDGIYGDGGAGTTLRMTPDGDGYVGRLVLGVQR